MYYADYNYLKYLLLKGEIRLLEFSNDYQKLYFTTSLHHSILCFSLSEERVISTTFPHPSPPTVQILSKDSSVLITASERPVVIYVHNLRSLTAPPILYPQASSSPVTSGEFHPDRKGVFLLCFLDGTIASYNISKGFSGKFSEDKQSHLMGLHGCEKSCFKRLHKTVDISTEPSSIRTSTEKIRMNKSNFLENRIVNAAYPIAGAAFVPGYRSRAVSTGADGKCRLIDFENEGKILRTWHIGASATCLSILGSHEMKPALETPSSHSRGHEVGKKDYIIAIGRVDGTVMLYDSVGLLIQERNVSESRARIISIAWSLNCTTPYISNENAYTLEGTTVNLPSPEDIVLNNLPSELAAVNDSSHVSTNLDSRKVSSIYTGDEGTYDTIIAKSKDETAQYKARLVPSGKLVDLFCSAKKAVCQRQPPRARPRLSSSTFVTNNPNPEDELNQQSKNSIVTKGFRCQLLTKCQRLELDGQGSNYKAKLETYDKLPGGLSESKDHNHGVYEDECAYPVPGSYFSSESSLDDNSDSGMDENSKVSRNSNDCIDGLHMPMNGTSTSRTSLFYVKSNDLSHVYPTKKSESHLSKSSLDDSFDEQHNPPYQNTQVVKVAFSARSSSASNERTSKGPRNLFSAIHPHYDWENTTRIHSTVLDAPLPRLTAENLFVNQATIQGASSRQLLYQARCNSATRKFSRSDKITECTEAEHLPEADEYNDYKSYILQKTDIADNPFDMQHMNSSNHHAYCVYMEKELRLLQPLTRLLTEKIIAIHKLMLRHSEEISNKMN